MSEYQISLPWPPSVNTYWRHARGRHYISEKGKKYRQAVIETIQQQHLDINTSARLKISISAHVPDRRRRDLDNLQKAVFDSLVHAGFMQDDEQIDDFRVRREAQVKGGELRVKVTELGGQMTQAEQYMSALVSLELASKLAQKDGRKINAAIRGCCAALKQRITDAKVLSIIGGLAKQPFPDGALKMLRRQLDEMVG